MDFEIKLAESSALGQAGQRVTLSLQPQDVHDPTELPSYLAGYQPFGYRADEMSPPVLVDNDQDKYRTFDSDDAFRRVDVKGSISGAVPEVDPKSALRNYKVIDRYVGSFVPRVTELATGNNYRPRMAAARRARRAIELDRELDVADLICAPGNWDTSVVTPAGLEWDDAGGTQDPVRDIQLAIEKSAQQVTEIWMNQRVAFALLRSPSVRDQMRQMLGDGAAPAAMMSVKNAGMNGINGDFVIPGLPPIKVSASKVKALASSDLDYVFRDPNLTATEQFDVVVLVHRPPGTPTDGEDIASTYTFRRKGPSGTGFEAREFFVDGRGALGGTMIVVSQADEAVITGDNVGGIITDVTANVNP
jgi:hypothetical protein